MASEIKTHQQVSDYYGRLLQSTADLKTSACCAVGAPPARIAEAIEKVHPDVLARFYGCGFPIPEHVEGLRVLDLGCGTGRDVFILAQLVGASGSVVGLDMTEAQLQVARDTRAWHAEQAGFEPNTTFLHGYIEDLAALDLGDDSFDLIASNCVVNLSPRKDRVLAEAHRVLAEGGEFYLSDVVVDRRLPEEVVQDPILYGECLGGALYRHDFESLARAAGFADPRVLSVDPIEIHDRQIQKKIGGARFYSVTYRLFKLPGLEERCEDYGQIATYRGGLDLPDEIYWLDDHHCFERGRPERVCGNTAAMLAETRLAPFFEVQGNRETHYGLYPCDPTLAAQIYGKPTTTTGSTPASGSCC